MATQPFQSLNLGVTPSNANLGEDYRDRDWDIVALLLLDKMRQLLAAGITLSAGDLEIGAVEIKNASTDDRLLIAAANATPTFGAAGLTVLANAADPTITEAKLGYSSVDLAGYGRTVLKAETTKVIGTINISAAQTIGTVTTVGTVTNLAQLGGVAIAMNTGTRSTGTQRVTIATDDLVPVTGTLTAVTTVGAVTAITNALPAGANLLGKTGIDQTTPGTTNNVAVKGATSGAVTVITTGAGLIAGTANLASRAGRTSVLIRNVTGSAETCYFGFTTGVTAGNGMPLAAGESVAVQNTAQIFFFGAAGTADIRCVEDFF